MPQNFIESRGEQGFLLPPDVRDGVPPDHLAWFVIDADQEHGSRRVLVGLSGGWSWSGGV